MILSACNAGKGEGEEGNLANFLQLHLPHVEVAACSDYQTGLEFELDEKGQYIEGSLRLSGPTDVITGDSTYRPGYEAVLKKEAAFIFKKKYGEIPLQFIEQCLRLGIVDNFSISISHEEGESVARIRNLYTLENLFKTGLAPEDYKPYYNVQHKRKRIEPHNAALLIREKITVEVVKPWFEAGVKEAYSIMQLIKHRVTIEDWKLCERYGFNEYLLVRGLASGLSIPRIHHYRKIHIVNPDMMIQLMEHGITPEDAGQSNRGKALRVTDALSKAYKEAKVHSSNIPLLAALGITPSDFVDSVKRGQRHVEDMVKERIGKRR